MTTEAMAMVERLKKEGDECRESGIGEGRSEGRSWAKDTGTKGHIRGIAENRIMFGPERPLSAWLLKHYDACYDEAYWRENCPDLFDDPEFEEGYTEGFVEAVTEAWNAVKNQI